MDDAAALLEIESTGRALGARAIVAEAAAAREELAKGEVAGLTVRTGVRRVCRERPL